MTDIKWKIGDVVLLKSDPVQRMTVTDVDCVEAGNLVRTAWFLGGKVEREFFPPDALKKPDDDSSSG